jgi:hypothetical protein
MRDGKVVRKLACHTGRPRFNSRLDFKCSFLIFLDLKEYILK